MVILLSFGVKERLQGITLCLRLNELSNDLNPPRSSSRQRAHLLSGECENTFPSWHPPPHRRGTIHEFQSSILTS